LNLRVDAKHLLQVGQTNPSLVRDIGILPAKKKVSCKQNMQNICLTLTHEYFVNVEIPFMSFQAIAISNFFFVIVVVITNTFVCRINTSSERLPITTFVQAFMRMSNNPFKIA
jgi:hypothetical protein